MKPPITGQPSASAYASRPQDDSVPSSLFASTAHLEHPSERLSSLFTCHPPSIGPVTDKTSQPGFFEELSRHPCVHT